MVMVIPEKVKEYEQTFTPYIAGFNFNGAYLTENAPEEAKEALKNFFKWFEPYKYEQ